MKKKPDNDEDYQHSSLTKNIQLYDGDGLEILKSSKFFNFECCKCHLVHKITIEWKKKSVILRFHTNDEKVVHKEKRHPEFAPLFSDTLCNSKDINTSYWWKYVCCEKCLVKRR